MCIFSDSGAYKLSGSSSFTSIIRALYFKYGFKRREAAMELDSALRDDDCESEESCELPDPDFEKTITECICPRCGVRHKMNLWWTGWGVPRKFCNACRKSVCIYDVNESFSVNINSE